MDDRQANLKLGDYWISMDDILATGPWASGAGKTQ